VFDERNGQTEQRWELLGFHGAVEAQHGVLVHLEREPTFG
jgi:hypothetical protein